MRAVVVVAVAGALAAPRGALAGGALDAARCALDLGEPGVGGVAKERAAAPAVAARIRTFSAKDAARLGKQLTARMPKGVTIMLDRAGMNAETKLEGTQWQDSARVGQFIHEHPCLFGLAATTIVEWTGGDINGLASSSGTWGLIVAGSASGAVVVEGHLWPLAPPTSVDLEKWRRRFPDVTTYPVRPVCDPVPGGPPDQCTHQNDPEIIRRVFAVRGLRCDAGALVSEDYVLVEPPPADVGRPFGPPKPDTSPRPSPKPSLPTNDQAFDAKTSKPRRPPPFVLEWNPPGENTANTGVVSGPLKCFK
jgi:hypothetical protein